MIDVREYKRFLQAAVDMKLRWQREKVEYMFPAFIGGVLVYGVSTKTRKYDYFLHPTFGVVVVLDDDGNLLQKTPLCEEIDKEIFK